MRQKSELNTCIADDVPLAMKAAAADSLFPESSNRTILHALMYVTQKANKYCFDDYAPPLPCLT